MLGGEGREMVGGKESHPYKEGQLYIYAVQWIRNESSLLVRIFCKTSFPNCCFMPRQLTVKIFSLVIAGTAE
jgi:hypothetical protein